MNYQLRVFEQRLNENNLDSSNRNDPDRIQENTNRNNPRNIGAISQGNIPRNENSNDLAFERNIGEETNLSGDANKKNGLKKIGDINKYY